MQGAQRAAPPAWFVVRERWAASREHPCCSHRAALPPRPDSFQEACHAPGDLASPGREAILLGVFGRLPVLLLRRRGRRCSRLRLRFLRLSAGLQIELRQLLAPQAVLHADAVAQAREEVSAPLEEILPIA